MSPLHFRHRQIYTMCNWKPHQKNLLLRHTKVSLIFLVTWSCTGDCLQQYQYAAHLKNMKNEMKGCSSKPGILFSLPEICICGPITVYDTISAFSIHLFLSWKYLFHSRISKPFNVQPFLISPGTVFWYPEKREKYQLQEQTGRAMLIQCEISI